MSMKNIKTLVIKNKMKKLLILIIPLFFSINSFCFDCKIISKEYEYSVCDLIVLGEITRINPNFYEINVLEFFKGKTTNKIRFIVSNSTIHPNIGDTWLLYCRKNNKSQYYVNVCGNSRSFRFPFNQNGSNFPKPPPKINNNLIDMFSEINYDIALVELNSDITNLRLIKSQNELNEIHNNYDCLEGQVFYLKLILLLFFVVFCLIIYKLFLPSPSIR